MAVNVFIVRHGNTFGPDEAPRRIGARTDLPLVESGRAQADALGRWFAAQDIRFDRVLTSPLRRTRETAGLILAHAAAPPPLETADWLSEIDHGPDEDRPETAVLARIGAEALAAWDARATPPPGWTVDAPGRIAAWRSFFADLRDQPPADILLVTSNGAARFALLALAGISDSRSLKLRTGAWGRIVVDGQGAALDIWDQRP